MGALAAIAAVCLLVATGMMEVEKGSYWELLYATNLAEGDTLGDQIQNMLACIATGSLIVFVL